MLTQVRLEKKYIKIQNVFYQFDRQFRTRICNNTIEIRYTLVSL